jgi:hypothetical protein
VSIGEDGAMSATAVPVRRRVLVRGELVHDLTLLAGPDEGFRLVLPQALPTLVLRGGSAERVDLLTGDRRPMASVLCGPSTRPWAVRDGQPVLVLRLRPEALDRLGVADRRPLVDGMVPLDEVGLASLLDLLPVVVSETPESAELPGRTARGGEVGAGSRIPADGTAWVAQGAAIDAALVGLAGPSTPDTRLLRSRLAAAVGMILAERGWVTTVEVARAAQLPPFELFRIVDAALGTGPEQLAAAQRWRCAVRDAVPADASPARVLSALRDLADLPRAELERLGTDPGALAVVLRTAAGLLGLG